MLIGVVMACTALAQDAPKPATPTDAPKAGGRELIRDPDWKPTVGDHAIVTSEQAMGCPNERTFEDTLKFVQAGDAVGIEQARKSGGAVVLARETGVLVIKVHRPVPRPRPSRSLGGDASDINRAIQADLLAPKDEAVYPVEVRITSGPSKDRVLFVPETQIGKLIPKPIPRGFTYRAPGELIGESVSFPPLPPEFRGVAPDVKVRADNMLRAARRAEKSNLPLALSLYLRITLDYPDLPQAKAAWERMASLGLHDDGQGGLVLESRKKAR
jgi:hypothetical protein